MTVALLEPNSFAALQIYHQLSLGLDRISAGFAREPDPKVPGPQRMVNAFEC
jgi:hypothetical protein